MLYCLRNGTEHNTGFLELILKRRPIGLIVLGWFVVYQQVENHVLYPLVYSRTVELSPLVILIAVLIGASVAGVIGALGAIPLAGTIQVLVRDWLRTRRERSAAVADAPL